MGTVNALIAINRDEDNNIISLWISEHALNDQTNITRNIYHDTIVEVLVYNASNIYEIREQFCREGVTDDTKMIYKIPASGLTIQVGKLYKFIRYNLISKCFKEEYVDTITKTISDILNHEMK